VQCTAPATTAIVSSLPAEKQGVASAVNDTAREVGGALGIAVLGSALNETYQADVREATAGLPETVAADATESLVYAQQAAPLVDRGAELVAAAEQAFVSGFSLALLVGAAVLVAGAVFVAIRSPGRHETGPIVADFAAAEQLHVEAVEGLPASAARPSGRPAPDAGRGALDERVTVADAARSGP